MKLSLCYLFASILFSFSILLSPTNIQAEGTTATISSDGFTLPPTRMGNMNAQDFGDDDDDDDDYGDDDDDDDVVTKPKTDKKGGKELDDSEIAVIQGDDGEVTCGEIKDGKWFPGIVKRELFYAYKKLFKHFRKLDQEGDSAAERKARNNKRKHAKGKSTCATLGSGSGGGDSGGNGGDDSGGDSGGDGGGGGNSNFIQFVNQAPIYGNGVISSMYRAYLGGTHIFTVAIGKGNSLLKAYHAAEIGLQYLDNNEDGNCDNPIVCAKLAEIADSGAILFVTENQLEQMGEPLAAGQPLYPNETQPESEALIGGAVQSFDFALEEVLHYLTDNGWGKAYPGIFGSSASSNWGQLVSAAISSSQYDPTASGDTEVGDFETTVPESLYWAITSLFGAQDFAWRVADIQAEWKSYNSTLLAQNVPGMLALIQDTQYGFPLNRPDAVYTPAEGSN